MLFFYIIFSHKRFFLYLCTVYINKIVLKHKILHRISKMLAFVPDPCMLRIQYRIRTGRWLNLDNPERFTEKIQWYKCKYRNPLMLQCTDKYLVRDYVREKLGGEEYLNELYQVHATADSIDFDSLPDRFVIKTTDGGNGENVLIVKDKSSLDKQETVRLVNGWRNKKYYIVSREWAYKGAQRSQVIVEKYMEDSSLENDALLDYKFFCFNGKPYCVQVDSDRFDGHRQNYYDMDWHSLGVHCTFPEGMHQQQKPQNFDEMVRVASLLSEDFPFVRVDLYNIGGKIYFGELTFYPSSGYRNFHPDSFDYQLGSMFQIK